MPTLQRGVLLCSLLSGEYRVGGLRAPKPPRVVPRLPDERRPARSCPPSVCSQEHNSECFDAFARAHIADDEGGSGSGSAAASAAGPPALPPAHRRALAEDTVERLRDIAEAWGEGGATPGAADGREADTPLTALPVDARRSFLRDVAAGRVRPPLDDGGSQSPADGRWRGWWEQEGTATAHHPAVAAALTAGRRRARSETASFGGSRTLVTEVAPRPPPGLVPQDAGSGEPGGGQPPPPTTTAPSGHAGPGGADDDDGDGGDGGGGGGPGGKLTALPWAATRVLAAADAGRLPSPSDLLRGRAPSAQLVGHAAESAFATVFVWRLYAGDPAGVDAAGACELLGSLAPSLVSAPPPRQGSGLAKHEAPAGASGAGGGAARGADAVLACLSASASAALRTAGAGPGQAALALADTAGVAASRRTMVETLARAGELLAASAADAMAQLAAAPDGARSSTALPSGASGAALGERVDRLALRLRKRLALPGLDVEPLRWRAAAAAALRAAEGSTRPLSAREAKASQRAVARVSAAYRKLWFLAVVAADAPDGWLQSVADGAAAAHRRATEEGGWAAPRREHSAGEDLAAAARAAGVPVGLASARAGSAPGGGSVPSGPPAAASTTSAAGRVHARARGADERRVAAARAELARLRRAGLDTAARGGAGGELEEMD